MMANHEPYSVLTSPSPQSDFADSQGYLMRRCDMRSLGRPRLSDVIQVVDSRYDSQGARVPGSCAIGGTKRGSRVRREPASLGLCASPGGIPFQLYGPRHLDLIGPPGSQLWQPTPTRLFGCSRDCRNTPEQTQNIYECTFMYPWRSSDRKAIQIDNVEAITRHKYRSVEGYKRLDWCLAPIL